MSSPGSGKTTTLKATIAALKDEMRIGVMEADIDSDVDAHTIAETGERSSSCTPAACATWTPALNEQVLKDSEPRTLTLRYSKTSATLYGSVDTGAVKNAMILSVPEGHDKPLKYPLMFSICDVLLVNKIDVMPYFDFDLDKCREYVKKLNPNITIIPISATGLPWRSDNGNRHSEQN